MESRKPPWPKAGPESATAIANVKATMRIMINSFCAPGADKNRVTFNTSKISHKSVRIL